MIGSVELEGVRVTEEKKLTLEGEISLDGVVVDRPSGTPRSNRTLTARGCSDFQFCADVGCFARLRR